jgi:putative MFS transporter
LLVSGGLFVATGSAAWLIASSFAFTLFSVIYTAALNIYAAELFPTGRRARSVATAWAFNRVGAAVAPLALLPLLRAEGPLAMYGLVLACLLASMALLAFSPPGQQRRSVA